MRFRNSYVAQKGRSTSLCNVGIASAALIISQLYERRNLRNWLGTWLSCTASQSRLLRSGSSTGDTIAAEHWGTPTWDLHLQRCNVVGCLICVGLETLQHRLLCLLQDIFVVLVEVHLRDAAVRK